MGQCKIALLGRTDNSCLCQLGYHLFSTHLLLVAVFPLRQLALLGTKGQQGKTASGSEFQDTRGSRARDVAGSVGCVCFSCSQSRVKLLKVPPPTPSVSANTPSTPPRVNQVRVCSRRCTSPS